MSTVPPTKTKKAPKNENAAATTEAAGAPATEVKKESKPRGPRKDYGFAQDSVIRLTQSAEAPTFRGQRLEWYNHLKANDGKTVAEFLEATKGMKDPGRGWLRFFASEESGPACTLVPAPKAPEAAQTAAA